VIDLILQQIPEIPVWPQLSAIKAEQMMIQYLEGLPGLRVSEDQVFVKTDAPEFEQELYDFYEEYLAVEAHEQALINSRFKMGPEASKTFFQFLESLKGVSLPFRALKGQVVGPFTLLAGLKDQQQRLLLYDERFQDVMPKHLAMKAKWQIHYLRAFDVPVIVFWDEPALAGFGSSAFISVSQELIHQLLKEVMDSVHQVGALAGVHVCANTDWRLAFRSPADVINFDAYSYFDRFALYREEFSQFMERGGTVAWGMVPTADVHAIQQETPQSLADRWFQSVEQLTTSQHSRERILSQSLFTPTCGCGTLPEADAERVVKLTRELSEIMKSHL
jgi:hypothetical protein